MRRHKPETTCHNYITNITYCFVMKVCRPKCVVFDLLQTVGYHYSQLLSDISSGTTFVTGPNNCVFGILLGRVSGVTSFWPAIAIGEPVVYDDELTCRSTVHADIHRALMGTNNLCWVTRRFLFHFFLCLMSFFIRILLRHVTFYNILICIHIIIIFYKAFMSIFVFYKMSMSILQFW